MAPKLLYGELPASSFGCVRGVWWLNPVLVCCLCHCSVVAHVENAVGSPRRSVVPPIRDWALLGGIMPDPSKSHEPNLEASLCVELMRNNGDKRGFDIIKHLILTSFSAGV